MSKDPGMLAPVTMPNGVPVKPCTGCGVEKSILSLYRIDATTARFCRSCAIERSK